MKTHIKLAFFLAITVYSGCKKEDVSSRDYPRLNTLNTTINTNSVILNAIVTNRGNNTILSYGFVWGDKKPTLENSEKVCFSKNLTDNKFSAEINSTLKSGGTYYVRAFVKTTKYTVYGNEISFQSMGGKAPEIISFQPLTGTWGDTIKITGKYFSYQKLNNIIKLGNLTVNVINASDTSLSVIVPATLNKDSVYISVSIAGYTATSKKVFHYLIPALTGISPTVGTFDDTLIIRGNNFGSKEFCSVLFNNTTAEVISVNSTQIKVVVPENLSSKTSNIKVISVGRQVSNAYPFELSAPVITHFEPDTVFKPNQVITLYGQNFNPKMQNNTVLLGGKKATILESSKNRIKVSFPLEVIPNYNISITKEISLEVTVAQQTKMVTKNLILVWRSKWTKKNNFPGSPRHNAVAFSSHNKGYFGTGVIKGTMQANDFSELVNDFWEYNAITDQWTQINSFPGNPRAEAVALTINDYGYVGLGSENIYKSDPESDRNHFNDFYKYDPSSNMWIKISDFSGLGRHSAASFVLNGEGYVGTGCRGLDVPPEELRSSNDIWKYNPTTNTWSEATKFPTATASAAGIYTENGAYVYDYNTLYNFDGTNWVKLRTVSLTAWDNVAFSIKNKIYFGLGLPHQMSGTNDLWEYDPSTGISKNFPLNWENQRWGASVFVINNKAYIIGGATYNSEMKFLNDVWEFDPSKPEL